MQRNSKRNSVLYLKLLENRRRSKEYSYFKDIKVVLHDQKQSKIYRRVTAERRMRLPAGVGGKVSSSPEIHDYIKTCHFEHRKLTNSDSVIVFRMKEKRISEKLLNTLPATSLLNKRWQCWHQRLSFVIPLIVRVNRIANRLIVHIIQTATHIYCWILT